LVFTRPQVFGGDKNQQRRAEELAKDIRACEASHRASVQVNKKRSTSTGLSSASSAPCLANGGRGQLVEQEYERIRERNLCEWERVTAARQSDLAAMLSGFARVECAYAQRAAAVWHQVRAPRHADASHLARGESHLTLRRCIDVYQVAEELGADVSSLQLPHVA
jgi:putative hemolysin